MGRLIASLFAAALVALLVVSAIGALAIRYQLFSVKMQLFEFTLAILLGFGGAWLAAQEFPGAKMFIFAGVITGVHAFFTVQAPETAKAGSASIAIADKEAARVIEQAAQAVDVPKEIACDKTTRNRPYFNREGKPLVFSAFNIEKKRWECFDRNGSHPLTGVPLVHVSTREMVAAILAQEPEQSPTPAPDGAPLLASLPEHQREASIANPTPLPDLGQRNIVAR